MKKENNKKFKVGEQLSSNTSSLIIIVSCISVLMLIAYFGVSLTSKGTFSADTCSFTFYSANKVNSSEDGYIYVSKSSDSCDCTEIGSHWEAYYVTGYGNYCRISSNNYRNDYILPDLNNLKQSIPDNRIDGAVLNLDLGKVLIASTDVFTSYPFSCPTYGYAYYEVGTTKYCAADLSTHVNNKLAGVTVTPVEETTTKQLACTYQYNGSPTQVIKSDSSCSCPNGQWNQDPTNPTLCVTNLNYLNGRFYYFSANLSSCFTGFTSGTFTNNAPICYLACSYGNLIDGTDRVYGDITNGTLQCCPDGWNGSTNANYSGHYCVTQLQDYITDNNGKQWYKYRAWAGTNSCTTVGGESYSLGDDGWCYPDNCPCDNGGCQDENLNAYRCNENTGKLVYITTCEPLVTGNCQTNPTENANVMCNVSGGGTVKRCDLGTASSPTCATATTTKKNTTTTTTVQADRECWYCSASKRKTSVMVDARYTCSSMGYVDDPDDLEDCDNATTTKSTTTTKKSTTTTTTKKSTTTTTKENTTTNKSTTTKSNVIDNPQTGSTAIIIAWVVGIVAIGYSFYYFTQTNKQ